MRVFVLAVIATLSILPAHAQDTAGNAPDAARRFAAAALAMNKFEMAAAEIVLSKGKADDSRNYAESMLKDHGRADSLLANATAREGLEVSVELTPQQQQKLAALKQSDAANFDQAYLSTQILAHEQAVSLFSDYREKGPPGPLRTLAEELLPELRTHLIRVQGLTAK